MLRGSMGFLGTLDKLLNGRIPFRSAPKIQKSPERADDARRLPFIRRGPKPENPKALDQTVQTLKP